MIQSAATAAGFTDAPLRADPKNTLRDNSAEFCIYPGGMLATPQTFKQKYFP